MSLAEDLYNECAPKGKVNIMKNIEEAIEDIKASMRQGSDYCDLYLDWTDLPDDWVVFPETLDYLRENGFEVEEISEEHNWSPSTRYARITWPDVNNSF